MSKMNYPQPFFRKLKGYAFDPSFSATLAKREVNEVLYKIKWEDTKPGPVGEYIAVIDYDPSKRRFYEPINLHHELVLADYGMELSEGDPRFHQQQVYAVIMSVINQFERALGRKVIWSKITNADPAGGKLYKHEFIPQLWVYPHAMRQQNAYYSPAKNALMFGYFQAAHNWNGNNVPGATVFTCLSPDIIAHETTHAILHSIHPYLMNDTNQDMLAFHEAFSDIIALLQRFTFRSVVEDQIRSSRGDLVSAENLLGDLAIQFGQAVSGNRRALRSFLVEKDEHGNWKNITPDPSLYHTITDPHSRGGILVAAIFDAFARLYKFNVADLIRLASNGSGILGQGEIDPDLVKRLSKEACHIADQLMMICIRALDYCPPADLTFGDYLRAIITADLANDPDDDQGIRYAIMESFRAWGIIPDEVNTFSVAALKWENPNEFFDDGSQLDSLIKTIKFAFDPEFSRTLNFSNTKIQEVLGAFERILRANDRKIIFEQTQYLAAVVHDLFKMKMEILDAGVENLLGMKFDDIEYFHKGEQESDNIRLRAPGRRVFQVYKCRPMILTDPHTGNSRKVMLIMFLQKVNIDVSETKYKGYFKDNTFVFRGGSSLIIDMANYEIQYVISKSICSSARLFRQLDFSIANVSLDNNALLMQDDEPFASLHIH
ncbi:gluzincin family metallopeptidase [Pedobacter psychroterrae]|uniref:Uncharacterized protein n=1 Tax=Pedobacter psychroterrae TaxID=2530453 RepID=A0A4V2MKY2_9SPHI|nr:hypothetical protein [Pedobacter psychroterrae]TCC99966.1 hypothetical protein EZ437_17150 [Pedobacter psychroterrae]